MTMQVKITITQEDVKIALVAYIREQFGFYTGEYDMLLEVKSRQNYKSEWEQADFRGTLIVTK